MKTLEQYDLNKLFCYYFFMALALSLCASWSVTDLLFLKMDFDLARFGIIKGHMFLLPAVAYFAVSRWIGRLRADVSVCVWSYFLRCALPLVLPVTALLTKDQDILVWIAAVVMAVSYTCAMFANNTLMKIMRTVLPPEKLNRHAVFLNSLLGLPGYLISIPAVWFLVRFGESRTAFLVWFTVLQIGTLLCEMPGIIALRKIRFPQEIEKQEKSAGRKGKLFHTDIVFAIIITTLHGLWLGLLSTYFVVYLIRNAGMDPAFAIWIDFVLSAVVLALSSKFGKWVDDFGYPKMFALSFFLMMLSGFAWGFAQTNLLLLILFTFLIHNGNSGFLAVLMRQAEAVAAVKLVSKENGEFMMGLSALLSALGCFAGCWGAGKLYEAVGRDLVRFFEICAPGSAVIFLFSLVWLLIKKMKDECPFDEAADGTPAAPHDAPARTCRTGREKTFFPFSPLDKWQVL